MNKKVVACRTIEDYRIANITLFAGAKETVNS